MVTKKGSATGKRQTCKFLRAFLGLAFYFAGMVWLLALLCLGIVGAAGFYQGPIRAGFSFLGLIFGTMLAGPLSPLTQHLLPLLSLHHPVWDFFAPQILAFLIVLTIFKIAGQVVHTKVAVFFKYKVDDKTLYRWQRVYSRTGLSVGMLNGAVYFLLISLLIYSAGYFTTEVSAGETDSAGAKFLTVTRADLHNANLDKVLASYDMVPPKVYQVSDLAVTVLHNPLLVSRLSHYPPCLELGMDPDFKELSRDVQFQQMLASQAKVIDVLNYPKVHYMLTNGTIVRQVSALIGNDLDDLSQYLMTGQSPKYDLESILGVWNINRKASLDLLRRKGAGMTSSRMAALEQDLIPRIDGLSLTATPDEKLLLKLTPNNGEGTVVATGTWKSIQGGYQVNLPGSLPETAEIQIEEGTRLLLPRSFNNVNYVLVFEKEQ